MLEDVADTAAESSAGEADPAVIVAAAVVDALSAVVHAAAARAVVERMEEAYCGSSDLVHRLKKSCQLSSDQHLAWVRYP